MKFMSLLLFGAATLLLIGCYGTETSQTIDMKATTPVSTSLDADLCAKCGCCAGCDDCCEGETCEKCNMQQGTALCCTGVSPGEGKYCKDCGHLKGSEDCCAEGNATCTKCGLAKGAPLCCKVKASDGHDHDSQGHEHDGDGHDHDHGESADHDSESKK